MNSSYLKRIIKISTNDNKRAQQILHKIGDNEESKIFFLGSILVTILLCIESILFISFIPALSILPMIVLFTMGKDISYSIIKYLRYRKYLRDNNVINIFGKCKNDNC